MDYYFEEGRQIPISGEFDVIVCGAGPAGVAAAVAASRMGMKTFLIETNGCIGGILTAGLLTSFIDSTNKKGIIREMIDSTLKRVEKYGAIEQEAMKLVLEEMCINAGVTIQLHTHLVGAVKSKENQINMVITESKSGREAWKAKVFIDATGDGDLGAFAGCEYSVGREGNGECQPMSLLCLISGIPREEIEEYICGGKFGHFTPKDKMLELIRSGGVNPSYEQPSLFHLIDDVYYLMTDHEYNVSATDAMQITKATIQARKEINSIIDAIRSTGGLWSKVKLISTAERIGVRDGRRIKGVYHITKDDLVNGKEHEDGICKVTFCVDVHSTNPKTHKGYGAEGIKTKPYDIPMRALIAKDVDGLLMAGRCISGDFYAHASYRVSGNAVVTGEAAGVLAATAVKNGISPKCVGWEQVRDYYSL